MKMTNEKYNVEILVGGKIKCCAANLSKEAAHKIADTEVKNPVNKTHLILIVNHLDSNGKPKQYNQ